MIANSAVVIVVLIAMHLVAVPSAEAFNGLSSAIHKKHSNSLTNNRNPSKGLHMLLTQQQDNSVDIAPSLQFSSSPTAFVEETTSVIAKGDIKTPYDLSPQQLVYVVLTSIFITCLIVADVIGVKLFEITLPFEILGHKTVEHTCGMLTFPITFILGDMINEYFGPKAAKNTVYIGLAMSILVFLVMNLAQAMPYLDKPFNVSKDNFDAIFGSAKLMYIASVVAYLIGSLSDIWLFGIIKKATKGKLLWLRATGSTVISQILDSFVVSYIAFSVGKTLNGLPPASFPEVLNIAATGYGLKFLIAASLTPALYALKAVMSERFGLVPIPYNADEEEAN